MDAPTHDTVLDAIKDRIKIQRQNKAYNNITGWAFCDRIRIYFVDRGEHAERRVVAQVVYDGEKYGPYGNDDDVKTACALAVLKYMESQDKRRYAREGRTMDPNATMALILDGFQDLSRPGTDHADTRAEVSKALRNLGTWIENGGFPPAKAQWPEY